MAARFHALPARHAHGWQNGANVLITPAAALVFGLSARPDSPLLLRIAKERACASGTTAQAGTGWERRGGCTVSPFRPWRRIWRRIAAPGSAFSLSRLVTVLPLIARVRRSSGRAGSRSRQVSSSTDNGGPVLGPGHCCAVFMCGAFGAAGSRPPRSRRFGLETRASRMRCAVVRPWSATFEHLRSRGETGLNPLRCLVGLDSCGLRRHSMSGSDADLAHRVGNPRSSSRARAANNVVLSPFRPVEQNRSDTQKTPVP